jgi:acetoacetate decarboxylase
MAGLTHFRTPSGTAGMIDECPYGWGADVVTVYFRCDPERLQQLLPGSLKAADGLCMAYIGMFHSASEDRPRAMLDNPDGAYYREAGLWIACIHTGRPGYFPAFVWVDREWSLVRGWLNGYPKKLANVAFGRPHPLNPVTGKLGVGAAVGGICSRHGHTLLRLGLTVERLGSTSDLQSRPATFGHRHWPALHPSQSEVSEIVEVNRSDVVVSDIWAGRPEFHLGRAPDEELDWFTPTEIISGLTYSYGFRIAGAKLVEPLLGSAGSHA